MKKLFVSITTVLVLLVVLSLPSPTNIVHAKSAGFGRETSSYIIPAMVKDTTMLDISLSAPFCECVVYVKNAYKLSGSAGYARNMGPFLSARGFERVYSPRAGDIIIMKQPFGHRIGYAGHVAILKTVQLSSPGTMTITIRGANQGLGSGKTPYWTENNCSNVNFWGGISYPALWGGKYVEYWRKK